jgi:hypothetical protein
MPNTLRFYWVLISAMEICLIGVFAFIFTGMSTLGSIILIVSAIISILLSLRLNKTKKESPSKKKQMFDDKTNSNEINFEMKVGKFIAVSIISIISGTVFVSYFGYKYPYLSLPVLLITYIIPIIIGIYLSKSSKSILLK